MITDHGHVKIMDFGVARAGHEASLTGDHARLGTPMYMSPEAFEAKDVLPASDIYSVGIVTYEMLAGRRPHDETEGWSVLANILLKPPQPVEEINPALPDEVGSMVMKMIARNLDDRSPECKAVLEDLGPILERMTAEEKAPSDAP